MGWLIIQTDSESVMLKCGISLGKLTSKKSVWRSFSWWRHLAWDFGLQPHPGVWPILSTIVPFQFHALNFQIADNKEWKPLSPTKDCGQYLCLHCSHVWFTGLNNIISPAILGCDIRCQYTLFALAKIIGQSIFTMLTTNSGTNKHGTPVSK